MIVLGEKHDGTNVLHVIIGPETEFQFNLSGHSAMDMTEYIKDYKPGERLMIVINRCDSEEEVLQMLNFQKAKYRAMNAMSQFASQLQGAESEKTEDKKEHTTPVKKGNDKGLKCPKCHTPGAAIVKDGSVFSCLTCQKIDDAIVKGKVPPLPSLNQLDELKKKTEDSCPEQRKSLFRFYKEHLKKDPPSDSEDNDTRKKKK